MGQMRFYAPTPEKLPPHAIQRAYLAGIEAIPWQSSSQFVDNVLTLERDIEESGNLYIPWTISGVGELTLSTCSLMERMEPYHLPLELARGTLNRARNIASEMANAGLMVNDSINTHLKEAMKLFVRASIDHDRAEQPAEEVIRHSSAAIESLCVLCTDQILRLRKERSGQLSTMMGLNLPSTDFSDEQQSLVLDTFNTIVLPFSWRDIQPHSVGFEWDALDKSVQWCKSQGLRICGGPLVQLDNFTLPEWLKPSDDHYEYFENHAIRFIEEVVDRYQDDVHIWQCASRLNVRGSVSLNEEHKLRLSVAAVESVRRVSPRAPVVVGFDQPWAEYLADDDFDLSPLHFADALVRADLGIAGVGLEVNLAYWPNGTLVRDLLEISRHIDRWSLLGIPLIVFLRTPSCDGVDRLASSRAQVIEPGANQQLTPARQEEMIRQIFPLLLSKVSVHGLVWNQWSDAIPHEFPHAGLIDADGEIKPVFRALAEIRQKHLL
jgi:hypothetical protein